MDRVCIMEIFFRVMALALLVISAANALSYMPEGFLRYFFGLLVICTVLGVPHGTHRELYIKSFLFVVIMFVLKALS